MQLYVNLHGMTNIPAYMIMLCGPTCIDSYLKIYVHVVAFQFLGKQWCQRVILVHLYQHRYFSIIVNIS